jgi:DNA helicase-2/ATP-dependent DNA helicase PcrA
MWMARKYSLEKTAEADDSLLERLNPAQREAASHFEGPLLILAGAGSGKTRVMTHRIAWLISNKGVHPEEILAMTFTNKACHEMRERVDGLLEDQRASERVTISTFHSLCARLLRLHARKISLSADFVIYDDADQTSLIRRVMEDNDRGSERSEARRLRGFIEKMKNDALTPHQAHEQAFDGATEQDVDFYQAYQTQLRASNCVDFGDLILGVLEIFRLHPDLASSYSRQWRFVMVDEFQDTNAAQYELLKHLTCEHTNLAVVGDDDQAIYRWRGATVANILGFEEGFPTARVVKLEQNYRSSQVILDAANDVIQLNWRRREKKLWTERQGGEPITYFTASDDREEAQFVAQRIFEMARDGLEYSSFAVFYRTNAQGRAFEEQLRFHGSPYQVVGGVSFYAREEVKDVLAYLKIALNPTNEVDLLRVINKPTRGVGKSTIDKLRVAGVFGQVDGLWGAVGYAVNDEPNTGPAPMQHGWLPGMGPGGALIDPALADVAGLKGKSLKGIREFHDLVVFVQDSLRASSSLAQTVQGLLERTRFFEWLLTSDPERAEDRQQNVAELVNAIAEFEKEWIPDPGERNKEPRAQRILRAFLDRSALIQSTDNLDERGAVTLMTVHGSKGLEFDTVFLVGMEEEIFPSIRDNDPDELDEERRLAYVAITRAERKLFITNAQRRRVYGTIRNTAPSRFVLDIEPERLKVDPRSSSRFVDFARPTYSNQRERWQKDLVAVGTKEWEFDQSPETRKGSIGKALDQLKARNADDEFSQLTPWEDLAAAAAPENVHDVSHWGVDASDPDELMGKTVTHAKFGIGKVKAVSGKGDEAKLTIRFPTVGEKKIVRRFVRIL